MRAWWSALAVLALSACGGAEQKSQESLQTFDVAQEPPPAQNEPLEPAQKAGAAAPQSTPQIAYTYTYGFRLPAEAIPKVQESHLKLCDRLGTSRCRVVEMARNASDGQASDATLTLQVSAGVARAFGDRLVAAASGGGAETVERGIAAEDLSKQIVDADARIRTKQALVERLTTLLETRSGNIEQAVAAERAINEAQEELEKGRGWLAEMRGRVAMSTIDIDYVSGKPLGRSVGTPLRNAFDDVGMIFAESLAILITIIAGILPWAVPAAILWWAVRRLQRRRRVRDDAMGEATGQEAVAVEPAPAPPSA